MLETLHEKFETLLVNFVFVAQLSNFYQTFNSHHAVVREVCRLNDLLVYPEAEVELAETFDN